MDSDLWNKVLEEDNQFRRQLIDQVTFVPSCLLAFNVCLIRLCADVPWAKQLLHALSSQSHWCKIKSGRCLL